MCLHVSSQQNVVLQIPTVATTTKVALNTLGNVSESTVSQPCMIHGASELQTELQNFTVEL